MRPQRSERRSVPSRHSSSPRTLLLRAGFNDAARAGKLLGDPALLPFLLDDTRPTTSVRRVTRKDALSGLPQAAGRPTAEIRLGLSVSGFIDALALTADPDIPAQPRPVSLRPPPPPNQFTGHRRRCRGRCTTRPAALLRSVMSDPATGPRKHRRRLLAVPRPQALGDFLVAHPEHLTALAPDDRAWDAPQEPGVGEALQRAVRDAGQADPADASPPARRPHTRETLPSARRPRRDAYRRSRRSSPMTSPAPT